jgi:chemotaxis signal transduction protein
MNGLRRRNTTKRREAASGDTRVIVVEEQGILTAIVVDKIRGMIRIPIGEVDPARTTCS